MSTRPHRLLQRLTAGLALALGASLGASLVSCSSTPETEDGRPQLTDEEKLGMFFENALRKAISQKGDGVYQDFKIKSVRQTERGGTPYAIVDFKYVLITGAGFEVERTAVASVA